MEVKLADFLQPRALVGDVMVSKTPNSKGVREAFIITGFSDYTKSLTVYTVLNLRSPLAVGTIPSDHEGYINVGRIESFVSERG